MMAWCNEAETIYCYKLIIATTCGEMIQRMIKYDDMMPWNLF